MDRAHRIGQKKEVQVFRFCTESSIEEKVRFLSDNIVMGPHKPELVHSIICTHINSRTSRHKIEQVSKRSNESTL